MPHVRPEENPITLPREISEQGERYLAVSLGTRVSGHALAPLRALRSSPGWLVSGPTAREWRFQGFTEQNEESLLYGPPVSGRSLEEVLQAGSDALPFIGTLVDALRVLSERGIPLFPLSTDSVLFTDGGGVLFLPPGMMQEVRSLRTSEANLLPFEAIHNPDVKGEPAVSFSVAALLYRALTGKFPFGGSTPEAMHEETRKREILSPGERLPGLAPEVSSAIMAGLGRAHGASPSLEQWSQHLAAWKGKPLLREPAPEEKQRMAATASRRDAQASKSFQRRTFWEKNWKYAAIIAAVAIAVGLGASSILKGVLAPRVTRGFSPEKVVQTFYQCMNTLDETTMAACVAGKAGRAELGEVTNLYVITRVTLGYEGKSNIVPADTWNSQSRPALAPPLSVYGVTDLTVVQEQGEPQPVFMVSYEKWTPVTSEPDQGNRAAAGSSGRQAGAGQGSGGAAAGAATQGGGAATVEKVEPRGTAIQDRVSLKKDKGDWVIFKIDRLRAEPVSDVTKK